MNSDGRLGPGIDREKEIEEDKAHQLSKLMEKILLATKEGDPRIFMMVTKFGYVAEDIRVPESAGFTRDPEKALKLTLSEAKQACLETQGWIESYVPPAKPGEHGKATPLKRPGPQIILVDFDGTVVEHRWPSIGPMMKNADVVMRRLYQAGHRLIIWTARSGDESVDVVKTWLAERYIPYHSFNKELPEHIAQYGNNPGRKIHGDVIIDDHCLGGLPEDWETIYDFLVEHHGIEDTRPPEKRAEISAARVETTSLSKLLALRGLVENLMKSSLNDLEEETLALIRAGIIEVTKTLKVGN